MKHLLVKGLVDYADEFDCEFFGIFTDKEWDDLCAEVKHAFEKQEDKEEKVDLDAEPDADPDEFRFPKEYEVYFGTNECLRFESYENWFEAFEVREISKEDYMFLKVQFGEQYGTGASAVFGIAEQLNEQ